MPTDTQESRRTPRPFTAVTLLKMDHQTVQQLFEEYDDLAEDEADNAAKQQLADNICAELRIHTQIEEEIFYPALGLMLEKSDLLDEARKEHASAKDLIAQIEGMSAGEDLFDAKVKVLGEHVQHHIREEEGQMFEQATASRLDLEALSDSLDERRSELRSELGLPDPQEEQLP